MNRRQFLATAAAGLALSRRRSYAAPFADQKPRRVGLIGTGWYGKSDLLRLIQVAPVEVVSLCDVDKRMLAEAADIVASRQASKKKPRLYHDYRDMLKEKDLDIVEIATPDHWHALPMIAAVQSGHRRLCAETDQRRRHRRPGHARRGPQVQSRGAGGHAAAQHAAPGGSHERLHPRRASWARSRLVDICCYWHMRATENPPDTDPPPNLDYEMWTGPAPMRPYNKLDHPRGWRAFMEYGNGSPRR